MKKSLYGPIVMGMAALMVATPVLSATTVKAGTTNNTAITQGNIDGGNALNDQASRADKIINSGKYNSAQNLTILTVERKYLRMLNFEDNPKMTKLANEFKAYLDKGNFGYSIEPWGDFLTNDVNGGFWPEIEPDTVFTFDSINKPQTQQLSVNGYTVLDNNGNPSNGNIKMWLDNDYNLHIDPNFTQSSDSPYTIKVLKNGDTNPLLNTNNGKWTNNKSTVTTSHMAYLYKLNGKAVQNRALAGHSVWFTDRYATINGVKMYRVATDEWVQESDLK